MILNGCRMNGYQRKRGLHNEWVSKEKRVINSHLTVCNNLNHAREYSPRMFARLAKLFFDTIMVARLYYTTRSIGYLQDACFGHSARSIGYCCSHGSALNSSCQFDCLSGYFSLMRFNSGDEEVKNNVVTLQFIEESLEKKHTCPVHDDGGRMATLGFHCQNPIHFIWEPGDAAAKEQCASGKSSGNSGTVVVSNMYQSMWLWHKALVYNVHNDEHSSISGSLSEVSTILVSTNAVVGGDYRVTSSWQCFHAVIKGMWCRVLGSGLLDPMHWLAAQTVLALDKIMLREIAGQLRTALDITEFNKSQSRQGWQG